jgi:hypothetical protein
LLKCPEQGQEGFACGLRLLQSNGGNIPRLGRFCEEGSSDFELSCIDGNILDVVLNLNNPSVDGSGERSFPVKRESLLTFADDILGWGGGGDGGGGLGGRPIGRLSTGWLGR